MRKSLKNELGITLVALIVTIIILLILAGISIASLTGSGLFEKAKLAKEKQDNAQIEEDEILLDYENKIGKYVDGTREDDYVTREEYDALLTEIQTLKNNTSGVGEFYQTTFSNFSTVDLTANSSNSVASITLPKGRYVLVGWANYQGTDLRYYISLAGASSSAYDNKGYVGMNITSIVNITEETVYNMVVYPSKDISLAGGYIKAIKIGN